MPSANKAGAGTVPGEIPDQQLEIAAFADTGDHDIKQIDGLPYLLLINADTLGHTVTLKGRGGGAQSGQVSIGVKLPPNSAITVPTAVFASVSDSLGNSNAFWALSDVLITYSAPGLTGLGSTGVPQTQGGSIGVVPTGATQDDMEFIAPTSLAQAAEATKQAGASVVPARHLVQYSGSCDTGTLATAADVLVYVALKGHTSGTYFVTMLAGTGWAGVFEMPTGGGGEKLDIVAANADTVAHGIAFQWASNGSG